MSKEAIIVGIAGCIVCLAVGIASIFLIQNDFIQLPILGVVTGVGAFLIYSMGQATSGPGGEPAQGGTEPIQGRTFVESPGTIEPEPLPESHQATLQGVSTEPIIENHGIIVRTVTKGGQTTYIEFADGYSLGTPPSPGEEEDKRGRYGAVKV